MIPLCYAAPLLTNIVCSDISNGPEGPGRVHVLLRRGLAPEPDQLVQDGPGDAGEDRVPRTGPDQVLPQRAGQADDHPDGRQPSLQNLRREFEALDWQFFKYLV